MSFVTPTRMQRSKSTPTPFRSLSNAEQLSSPGTRPSFMRSASSKRPSSTSVIKCQCIACDMYSTNCDKVKIQSPEEGIDIVCKSFEARTKVSVSGQRHSGSSRGHVICTVYIEDSASSLIGKVLFVDLAGGDRITIYNKVDSGDSLESIEAHNINTSLLTLGEVLHALAYNASLKPEERRSKRKHVPFMQCKLTHILRDSFGYNSRTSFITHISPALSRYQQSLNAMSFTERVRNIRNLESPRKSFSSIHPQNLQRYGDDDLTSFTSPSETLVKKKSKYRQSSPTPTRRSKDYSKFKTTQESIQSDVSELRKTLQLKTRENTRMHLELESLRYQNSASSRQRRQDLKTTEEERRKLQSEISILSKVNLSLRQDNEQLDVDFKRFRYERDIEVAKHKNEILALSSNFEQQLAQLQTTSNNALTESENTKENTFLKLSIAEKENQELLQKIIALSSLLSEKDTDLSLADKSFSQLQQTSKVLETKAQYLSEDNESIRDKLEHANQLIEQDTHEINFLKKSLINFEEESLQLARDNEALLTALEENFVQFDEASRLKDNLLMNIADLETRLGLVVEDSKRLVNRLRNECIQAKEDMQNFKNMYETLQKELSMSRKDFDELQTKFQQKTSELSSAKQFEDAHFREICNLQKELQQGNENINFLKAKEAQLEESEINVNILTSRNQDLENQNNQLREVVYNQKQESDESAHLLSALEEGSRQLRLELEEFARDKESAGSRLASLESDLQAASDTITSLSRTKTSLEVQL
eukprot:gene31057-40395_t